MSANIKQYFSAFVASQRLADAIEINSYPVDMFNVLKHIRKVIVSSFYDYKIWAESTGRSCPNELQEAKCYYDSYTGICIIVYNEKKPKLRIRFSLAHELGHIVLGHLTDERTEIERGGLDSIVYFAMEGAANTFAGNFLAPPILIHEFLAGKPFDIDSVASYFNLSKQAVRGYRRQDYLYWLSIPNTQHEKHILNRCKQHYYTFCCSRCNYLFSIEQAKYCPVCGNSITQKELGDINMGRRFPDVELTRAGRLKECINCENEDLADDVWFCMICGKPVVNLCLNATSDNQYKLCDHTEPLPGNARYCPYCGSKTIFFERGVLPDWTQVPVEDPVSKNIYSDNTRIDDDDADLPF